MKEKTIVVDRVLINIKASNALDITDEQFYILTKVLSKTIKEESKKNKPIMDVKMKESEAKKVFPELFAEKKKVMV